MCALNMRGFGSNQRPPSKKRARRPTTRRADDTRSVRVEIVSSESGFEARASPSGNDDVAVQPLRVTYAVGLRERVREWLGAAYEARGLRVTYIYYQYGGRAQFPPCPACDGSGINPASRGNFRESNICPTCEAMKVLLPGFNE